MRVVVLSQWLGLNADGVSGGLGRALSRRGVQVEYAAGAAISKDWQIPAGRHQFLPAREVNQCMPTVRYPYFRSHDGSSAKRALTYSTFAASTALGAQKQLARADVVLVNGTPATAATAAMVARKRYGIPFVFLVPDVWPDSIFASGFLTKPHLRRFAERPIERFVEAVYKQASAVIGISPGMRDLLISRGVASDKAHYIYNWADEGAFAKPITIPERRPGEPLRLMYAGNLGFAQDLGNLLDAIDRLPRGTVSLTLVGAGAAEASLRSTVAERGITSVHFHPPVAKSELPALMSRAHAQLISLADNPLFRITTPSKLQSTLAAGAPVLCCAPGEVANLVEKHGVGLATPPSHPEELARAIQSLAQMKTRQLRVMGKNARALYINEMGEEVNGNKLLEVLSHCFFGTVCGR